VSLLLGFCVAVAVAIPLLAGVVKNVSPAIRPASGIQTTTIVSGYVTLSGVGQNGLTVYFCKDNTDNVVGTCVTYTFPASSPGYFKFDGDCSDYQGHTMILAVCRTNPIKSASTSWVWDSTACPYQKPLPLSDVLCIL
jgi:hypothetical protein